MIGGMTVATLVGVPLGTLITNTLTWRPAFLLVSLAGVVTFFAIRRLVRMSANSRIWGSRASSAS